MDLNFVINVVTTTLPSSPSFTTRTDVSTAPSSHHHSCMRGFQHLHPPHHRRCRVLTMSINAGLHQQSPQKANCPLPTAHRPLPLHQPKYIEACMKACVRSFVWSFVRSFVWSVGRSTLSRWNVGTLERLERVELSHSFVGSFVARRSSLVVGCSLFVVLWTFVGRPLVDRWLFVRMMHRSVETPTRPIRWCIDTVVVELPFSCRWCTVGVSLCCFGWSFW